MKRVIAIISGVVLIIVSFVSLKLLDKSQTLNNEKSLILKVWHIDTFEGGKGSRYNFLREEGSAFTKKNKGVYLLIINHTIESAKNALFDGNIPDLISYGSCGIDLTSYAKEIKFNVSDGGIVNGKRFAVSYLRGGYFAIKKGTGENLILSKNTYTTPEIACLFNEVYGNYIIKTPLDAYTYFLQRQNATLIGTQRDVFRLRSRGVDFTATPITKYSDLYQYISLTTKDENKEFYALKFISHLLSDKVQEKVKNLGMFSVTKNNLYSDDELFSNFEKVSLSYTLTPFAEDGAFNLLCERAISSLDKKESVDSVLNFLKYL